VFDYHIFKMSVPTCKVSGILQYCLILNTIMNVVLISEMKKLQMYKAAQDTGNIHTSSYHGSLRSFLVQNCKILQKSDNQFLKIIQWLIQNVSKNQKRHQHFVTIHQLWKMFIRFTLSEKLHREKASATNKIYTV